MDDLGKKLVVGMTWSVRSTRWMGAGLPWPFFTGAMAMTYREDLYQQAGLQAPDLGGVERQRPED